MTAVAILPARPGGRVVRRWVATVLVVVTTLLVVASTVAVWAHRTVLDTDDFMDAVTPVLDDPAFYDALADHVTEQTLLALDLDARAATRLTELDEMMALALVEQLDAEPGPLLEALSTRVDRLTLATLAPVVADRFEERVETLVHRLVDSEAFHDRLPQLVERAHRAAVGVARADGADHPDVYLTDDAVVLDTTPLIAEALREALGSVGDMLPGVTLPDALVERAPDARAQLGAALGTRLPDGFGQVALLDRETFDLVQGTVTTVDRAVWVLVALTVLLVVVTVAVAPARRRVTVQLGIGVVAGLMIAAALVARLRDLVVDAARTTDGERVATVLFDAVAADLHEILWLIGIVAAVGAVVAVLLGRPAWLRRAGDRWPWLRATDGEGGGISRRVAGHADALRVVVVAVAVLVVVLTGFSWVGLVLVGLFLAVCLVGISVAQRIADVPGERRSAPAP